MNSSKRLTATYTQSRRRKACILLLLACIWYFRFKKSHKIPNLIRDHNGIEENILNLYDDNWLRMSKERFIHLVSLLTPSLERRDYFRKLNGKKIQQTISPFIITFIGIRYMAGGKFDDIARILSNGDYPFAKSTFYRCIDRFVDAIFSCEKLQIRFDMDKIDQYVNGFRKRYPNAPFLDVFGVLDGSELEIESRNAKTYNRGGFKSIKLIALCDSDARFLQTYIEPIDSYFGDSSFDSSRFHKTLSKIATYAENLENGVSTEDEDLKWAAAKMENKYILANNGFHVERYLLKPFPKTTTLKYEKKFNRLFSSIHVRVEHAFGLFKGIFGILQSPFKKKIQDKMKLVHAMCCMYNFIMDDLIKNYKSDEEIVSSLSNEQKERYKASVKQMKI